MVPDRVNSSLELIDNEYKAIVEEAAKKDLNLDISNSTLQHAVFLSQTLISKAENNIKILTGELNSPYYDRIKENLEDAAKRLSLRKGEIKIIIWDQHVQENTDFKNFADSYKNTVKIKKANQTDGLSHFLVSDSKRYRLEEPHTKEDLAKEAVKGTANFNNPETANILSNSFDKIWDTLPV